MVKLRYVHILCEVSAFSQETDGLVEFYFLNRKVCLERERVQCLHQIEFRISILYLLNRAEIPFSPSIIVYLYEIRVLYDILFQICLLDTNSEIVRAIFYYFRLMYLFITYGGCRFSGS